MKPSDLNLLTSVSHPTVSPDGTRIVFAVARPDVASNGYVGQLWQVPADGSASAERLTRGHRDTSPAFSPDGALIAFLRSTPGGAPQLHVVRALGGEPLAVTDQKLGVSEFSWSPDGQRIVFVARVPEQGRYGTVEGISASAEPGREITVTRYLSNGEGYVTDQRAQIFVVEVPDVTSEPFVASIPTPDGVNDGADASRVPTPVQLTDHDADHASARFTPDNRAVTFVAALHASRDFDLGSQAWSIGLSAGGAVTGLTELLGSGTTLAVEDVISTPSGTTFALASDIGESGLDFVGVNPALYALDAAGGDPRRLTDPETLDLSGSHLELAADDAVYALDATRGSVQLLRVDAEGTVTRLTSGALEVTAVAAGASTVCVSLADPGSTGDIAVLLDGNLERRTDFAAPLRQTGLIGAEEMVGESRDGTPIHGWALVPDGDGPHPTLLVIHGGPYAQFTASFFDEAQVYAAAGYGVVMCNPRGASGYGQTFGQAIKEALGTVDMTDVLDFLDGALAAHPTLDAGRVGIMGGSYGGYLTAWTIAHEHRFAAAIVERGYLDPELMIGTSDIGTFFSEQYTGTDPVRMKAQSPQAVVAQVTTPTFVIHSEDDLRCPLSQAQRYHLGLVRAGVETKMLIFPGENHELSRSGQPRHRVQRFDAILDWWGRYLPVGA